MQNLFTETLLEKMEDLLKKGKTIELQYIYQKQELKIGVTNYHRVKIKENRKNEI